MEYIHWSTSLTAYLRQHGDIPDIRVRFSPICDEDIARTDMRAATYDARVEITAASNSFVWFIGYVAFGRGEVYEEATTINAVPWIHRWMQETTL